MAANAKALKEYDWIVYWKTNDRPAESPNEAISHDPHPNSSPDDPYGSGNSGPMRIFPGEKGDMLLFQRKFREKGDMLLFQRHFPATGISAPLFCQKKGTCYFFRVLWVPLASVGRLPFPYFHLSLRPLRSLR